MDELSQDDAYKALVDYITKKGGAASAWYCGITNNPRVRLFTQHKVNEEKDAWIYVKCSSKNCASNVENRLHDRGHDGGGGPGGAGDDSKYVYAFKK